MMWLPIVGLVATVFALAGCWVISNRRWSNELEVYRQSLEIEKISHAKTLAREGACDELRLAAEKEVVELRNQHAILSTMLDQQRDAHQQLREQFDKAQEKYEQQNRLLDAWNETEFPSWVPSDEPDDEGTWPEEIASPGPKATVASLPFVDKRYRFDGLPIELHTFVDGAEYLFWDSERGWQTSDDTPRLECGAVSGEPYWVALGATNEGVPDAVPPRDDAKKRFWKWDFSRCVWSHLTKEVLARE